MLLSYFLVRFRPCFPGLWESALPASDFVSALAFLLRSALEAFRAVFGLVVFL